MGVVKVFVTATDMRSIPLSFDNPTRSTLLIYPSPTSKSTIWYKGHATKTVGPTSYLLSRFSLLNYAPHLEVAEYRDINQKKANKLSLFIYFFVSFLVLLFNIYVISLPFFDLVHEKLLWLSVDWPTTGILTSPSLLDTLVQSCGYPFHLQISLSRNS